MTSDSPPDPTRTPLNREDAVAVEPRYNAISVEPDSTVIYDSAASTAWIQSTDVRDLDDWR